ncbi:MAG: ABC transporter permease [Clostridiales Family XIII bacterium]|jgi:putative ABC transport system permease protein|nr:ABC transporter permease [Clostridiales Family XIII bacterium]
MAWKSIAANKIRAFLTMLGIIIGVMSLVVLVSLVTSATSSVTSQIESMGSDMLTVSVRDDKGLPLRLADLSDIAQDESISMIAPTTQTMGSVKSGSETTEVSVEGTNASYFQIQGDELASGRLLKSADLENTSYVAVLSNEAAVEIYGTADATGQTMVMNGSKFLVVGVLAEDDSLMASIGNMYSIYIPYTVAERLADSSSGISSFYAAASDPEYTDRAEAAIEAALLSRFKNDEDSFYILNQSVLAETMSSVTNTFALLLGGIAAISLLVGGIGIMNIMLVSVTERTREIGIRKAIGANKRVILLQFLVEALMICLIGCALGIALSGGILLIVNIFTSDTLTFTFSGSVILVAVLFSTFIGVVFGLYPARKAANMHPIDALRYE